MQRHPNTLPQILLLLIGLFVFLLIGQFCHFAFFSEFSGGNKAFELNNEHNIPTFYQAILWLFCSFFSFRIGKSSEKSNAALWFLFSFVFFFLSLDEYFMIHDGLSKPMKERFNLSGALHFGWVIPYAILLLILAPFAWKFVKSLPKAYSIKFVFSGIVFVFGAMGVEMIGAGRHELYGKGDKLYIVFTSIEESLEIIGISLFLYFLIDYASKFHPQTLLTRRRTFQTLGFLTFLATLILIDRLHLMPF